MPLDGYVGISDMMPELILPRVSMEEGVEIRVARAE